jgi:hypothetical protein
MRARGSLAHGVVGSVLPKEKKGLSALALITIVDSHSERRREGGGNIRGEYRKGFMAPQAYGRTVARYSVCTLLCYSAIAAYLH